VLDRLIERAKQELRLPDIIGERCVHALMEQASCQACVDVCPSDAWILTDDCLGIDPAACDGCGLCAAVCPQAAVIHHHEPLLRDVDGIRSAFFACEHTGLIADEGVIPCVHAVGLRDLLRLYHQGCRQLVVSSADCANCPRGNTISLIQTAADLNGVLEQRALPPLQLMRLSAIDWEMQRHRATATAATGSRLNRRFFLRRAAATALDEGLRTAGLAQAERDQVTPPGELLADESAGAVLPIVPQLDSARCNGCDACVRLCPHGALQLEKDSAAGSRYRITASRCSGCGLCADVCDQDAVRIDHWQPSTQTTLELDQAQCRACGAPFHTPSAQTSSTQTNENGLCRICSKTQHYRMLYQVMN
jgi:ferredoxin